MKTLCKLHGGSKLYGLDTPESDLDERGVFLNTEIRHLVGLDKFEHLDKKGDEDVFLYELRHFLGLCRKTNTQVLEILWCPKNKFIELDEDFYIYVINKAYRLMDTQKFYKSLRGYIFGEKRLLTGERTGLLGSKRKEALDKYGYSYKNAVQLIRLCYVGVRFFKDGIYPVTIKDHDEDLHDLLMTIKTKPETFTLDEILHIVEAKEKEIEDAYQGRNEAKDYQFDTDYANWLCLRFYGKLIKQMYEADPHII